MAYDGIDNVSEEDFVKTVKKIANKSKYPRFKTKIFINKRGYSTGRIIIPSHIMRKYPELLNSVCEFGIFSCSKQRVVHEPVRDYKKMYEETMAALQRQVKERDKQKKEAIPRFKSLKKVQN